MRPADAADESERVAALVARARAAMDRFSDADQARVDEAVTALAWSIYKPEHARELAEMAVMDTGLGNVDDKITKNQRKTFGTLRDLMRARTVGVIEEHPDLGIVKYAKPVGVVAAVTPSTNPAATPVNKAMMAVKGRNAVIIAPSPAGLATTTRTVALMRAELARIDAPEDLVQVLPAPVNKALTHALMQACDLTVVTGSQSNVRAAYSSGKPAIGVGAGNVPVIIDASADLDDAAAKICASKTFDNATSCSSENSVVILDAVYDAALEALARAGGYLADDDEKRAIAATLWVDGHLNRKVIAKDADVFAREAGLDERAQKARFLMVEESAIGPEHPFCDEKLALVLSVYRAANLDDAIAKVRRILDVKGRGHSCGIHTGDLSHARRVAEEVDVVRVLVNQAHTFGNGGGFDSGLNFTLSMGCGTWGGNSISENLNYRHFINITHLATTIPEDKPSEEALFGSYWKRYGR
ncbi:MAG: aldehyde dehydrogenase family protein [Gammaproteobacteria bacterium]|nr:aldehyde dehydrogenase family protein [Gammaproteobacteria bacterium]NIM74427.1 aldehyde dehydrogenase family protein [Gammaproteobacteria bacterium]NIO26198.1 aldehyde dehydrogenase family protein [Gammaproteobacteria bacterium]NIO66812.1 aldehyde dehydrogenase family protein [Gammaproteobacteria bacterium]NIP65964.1 aldehyde dehydrogenase family protein [Gammaproteobacteria bacterium]